MTGLEPGLVHAVGASGGCGAGRIIRLWLSGLRQEERIPGLVGRALSFLFDAENSASEPFGESPSFSFVPGRAAGLARKMFLETHKHSDAGTALWSPTLACGKMLRSQTTWHMRQAW